MIISLIFLALSLTLGFSAIRLIPIKWYKPEATAASIAVGLLFSSWIAFLSCWIVGYTFGPTLTFLILIILTSLAWYYQPKEKVGFEKLPSRKIAWILLTIISSIILGELFFTHMLMEQDGSYYSGGSTWGDIALHLSLITRFANETHFTWDLPIMVGAKLTYPFLIDFLAGILYRWGLSLQLSILIPGFLLAVSIIQLLYFTSYRLFQKTRAAAFAPLLFLVNGGIAGLWYFWKDWQVSGQSLGTFLVSMTKNYTNLWDNGLFFSNIVVDYLLPQRGILFGLTLFLIITNLLWHAWHNEKHSYKFLVGVIVIGGLLPLAHAHTFFVTFGLLGYLTTVQIIKKKWQAAPYIVSLLLMSAIAFPQITWQIASNFTDSFSRFQFGWMKPAGENIIGFWLRNWGVALPFAFLNIWTAWKLKKKSDFYIHWYIPLLLLWFITNVYVFQPFVYDNMKFMVYSFLALTLVASFTLDEWFSMNKWYKTAAGICLTLLILPGVISLIRESYTMWNFSDLLDRQTAVEFAAIVPSESRVLTSDQHNLFVPTLVGRRIVLGYRGWLWTYGLNYQPIERVVYQIYSGSPEAAQLINKYDIDFVLLSPSAKDQYPVNQTFFTTRATLVLSNERYQLYDVRTLRQ